MMEYIPAVDIKQLVMSDQPMPLLPKRIRKALKESIKERGIVLPLVVERKSNGVLEIIDGRNRWEIANELAMNYVPCLIGDEDDPFIRTLKYDLELCRRSLSEDEYNKFSAQREEYLKDLIRNVTHACLEKVVPEFREVIARIYKDDVGGLMQFAKLPVDKQKAILESRIGIVSSELEKELKATRDEISRLQAELKHKEEIEERYNLFLSTTQKQIEKRLAEKEKELEEKYKGNMPDDIKKLIAEERKKIEAEYKNELADFHNKLVELSRAKDSVSANLEQVKEQLRKTEDSYREVQKIVEKYKKENESMRVAISQLTSPDALMKQLDSVYADIQSTTARFEVLCKDLMRTYKGISSIASSLDGQGAKFLEKIRLISESISNIKVSEARNIVSEMERFLSK